MCSWLDFSVSFARLPAWAAGADRYVHEPGMHILVSAIMRAKLSLSILDARANSCAPD